MATSKQSTEVNSLLRPNTNSSERWSGELNAWMSGGDKKPSSAQSTSEIDRQPDSTPPLVSGSYGKLGYVLEKMHRGELLSQHDVSAALREYNLMLTTIAGLEWKTKHLKLQVSPEDALALGNPKSQKQDNPNMVTMKKQERDKLHQKIERKDNLIADLQRRLKDLTHVNNTNAIRSAVVPDLPTPGVLVNDFCDLYEKEWSYAYETLKTAWKNSDRAVFTLFRIVRHAYVFCSDIAEAQRGTVEGCTDKLQETMLHPSFIHPVTKLKYKASITVDAETQTSVKAGRRLIADYRGILVKRSVPGLQELFRKVKLPEFFESGFVTKAIQAYVNRCVEILWLMVIQEPPMLVYWLEPKRSVLPEYFTYLDHKGPYVKQTVWPAVFSKEDGPILSKGVLLATETDDEEEDDDD